MKNAAQKASIIISIATILASLGFIFVYFAFPPAVNVTEIEKEPEAVARTIETEDISEEETAMEARWAKERVEDAKADIEAVNAMVQTEEERIEEAHRTMLPDTMEIDGNIINIAHILGPYAIDRAPDGVAATFMTGDGCTTDNEPTYFIGHNPGVFAPVIAMEPGDTVTICDKYGDTRTYEMVDRVTIDRDTWVTPDVRETLFLDGESVSLQACDGGVMRVIRCKTI